MTNILESILNEISAEDAYNKFYNKIPRELYNELISTYGNDKKGGGKFDNLMKLILNDIIKTDGSVPKNAAPELLYGYYRGKIDSAKEFLIKYKNVPNEVRIQFLNNLKKGEYADLFDMAHGLEELSSNGVETLKSMQNSGLIKLYEDKDYTITCTTTYEANHHFYGKSSWCTASDRLGRYDGWKYFLCYTFDLAYYDIEDEYDTLLNDHTIEACLIQFINRVTNETYQIQYDSYSDNQICDFKDDSVEFEEMQMPDEIRQQVFTSENIKHLIELTKESMLKEYPYQRKKDEYIIPKRARMERERGEMTEQLSERVVELAAQKANFIKQKVVSVFDTNLFESIDFLQEVVKSSIPDTYERMTDEKLLEYEEILKKHAYIYPIDVSSINNETDTIMLLVLGPVFGCVKVVDYENNGNPYLGNYFSKSSTYEDSNLGNYKVIAVVEGSFKYDDDDYIDCSSVNIRRILKIFKNDDDNCNIWVSSLKKLGTLMNKTGISDYADNWIMLDKRENGDWLPSTLYNVKTLQTFKFHHRPEGLNLYNNFILGNSDYGEVGDLLNLSNGRVGDYALKIVLNSYSINNYEGYWFIGKNKKNGKIFLFADKIVDLSKYNLNFNSIRARGYDYNFVDIYTYEETLLKYDGNRGVVEKA